MGLVGVLYKGEEVENRWERGKEGEQERKVKEGGWMGHVESGEYWWSWLSLEMA